MTLNCAKCGACTAVCPVYQVTGRESLTARGKQHLLERLAPSAASGPFADILSQCLLCGACHQVCPQRLDTPARLTSARGELSRRAGLRFWRSSLARQLLARPALLQTAITMVGKNDILLRRLPLDSGLRLRLGLGFGERRREKQKVMVDRTGGAQGPPSLFYFTGCYAAYAEPEIATATDGLVRKVAAGKPVRPDDQACCGQAAWSWGDLEQARRLAKINIAAFAHRDLPILTSCASCYRHLLRYPELLAGEAEWVAHARNFTCRLLEFSSYFNQAVNEIEVGSGRIHYHDPCHLRHGIKITTPPRELLGKMGMQLAELPGGPRCCGLGGLFHLSHPDLAADIGGQLLDALLPLAPELVTTTCSGCLLQFRQGLARAGVSVPTRHLAEVLARHLLRQGD